MNTPEQRGGFSQFPLCLLAQPIAFPNLLTLGWRYGVCHFIDVTYGKTWRIGSLTKREAAFEEARRTVNFTGGSPDHCLTDHDHVSQIEESWRTQGRKTCWVRLRKDLFFDVRDQGILSERDWRVLCAIFSAIGDKEMVKLGWQGIQYRAAGWLTAPPPGAAPCGLLYPRNQIERSVAELVSRGFVFVATYRRGERYWSHRNNHAGLWKQIEERKLHRPKAQAARLQFDRTASALIHAELNPGTPVPHPALVKTIPGFPKTAHSF